MKRTIRLTESDLHKLIKRCVKEALSDKVERAIQMGCDWSNVNNNNFRLMNSMPDRYSPNYGGNNNVYDLSDDSSPLGDKRSQEMDKLWDEHETNETRIRNIVRESVRKVLSEEVDTGQVTAAWEKEQKPPESPRIKRLRQEIARLRREIVKAEEAGEDIKPIQDQIKLLKKQAGFTNVEESRESEMDADWRSMTQPSYAEMQMMDGRKFWPDENLNIYDAPYHIRPQEPGNDAMRALHGDIKAQQMRSTVRGMRDAGMNVGKGYDWMIDGDPRRK